MWHKVATTELGYIHDKYTIITNIYGGKTTQLKRDEFNSLGPVGQDAAKMTRATHDMAAAPIQITGIRTKRYLRRGTQ